MHCFELLFGGLSRALICLPPFLGVGVAVFFRNVQQRFDVLQRSGTRVFQLVEEVIVDTLFFKLCDTVRPLLHIGDLLVKRFIQ